MNRFFQLNRRLISSTFKSTDTIALSNSPSFSTCGFHNPGLSNFFLKSLLLNEVRRFSTSVRSPGSDGLCQQKDVFLGGSLVKFAKRQQGKHSSETSGTRRRRSPQKTIFLKQRKGRMNGISCQGNHISFGRYALQALEPAWITARQIEAGRKAIVQNTRRVGGKLWVRMIPDKPVTVRPTETRMGRGKGAVAYQVAVVKPGRILYEIGGVCERRARQAISIAAAKMPMRTKFSFPN